MGEDAKKVAGRKEKAELLNSFFASMFKQKAKIAQPIKSSTVGNRVEMQIKIDKELVIEHLSALDEFKFRGPDGLHARILKELAGVISEPLDEIFSELLEHRGPAENWKKTDVVPIFINRKKDNPGNYRLLSLIAIPEEKYRKDNQAVGFSAPINE